MKEFFIHVKSVFIILQNYLKTFARETLLNTMLEVLTRLAKLNCLHIFKAKPATIAQLLMLYLRLSFHD